MLLEQNVVANFTLNYQKATFFAPTNEAFQKFKGPLDEKIILYHIGEFSLVSLCSSDYKTPFRRSQPPEWRRPWTS